LAKGLIALEAVNAFVCCVCWAGTFAHGGRNVLMRRYVINEPAHVFLNSAPSCEESGPPSITHGSLGQAQTASRSVQPFLYSSPVCPKHTHRPRYVRHLAAPMNCVQAMRPKRLATAAATTAKHNIIIIIIRHNTVALEN